MVRAIGHQVFAALDFVGDSVLLLLRSLAYLLRGRVGIHRTLDQMAIAGADSLPIATVTLFCWCAVHDDINQSSHSVGN